MRLSVAAAPVVLAAAFAGCGGTVAAPSEPLARAAARPVKACRVGVESRLGSRRLAYAAVAQMPLRAFRAPGGAVLATFERLNANRVPNVFGALGGVKGRGCKAAWYRGQPPMRPHGSVGEGPSS